MTFRKGLFEWLLLIGTGLTAVLLAQVIELPYHREFYKFHTLFLPLFLLSSAIFCLLGVPLITLLFWPQSYLARHFKGLKKWAYLITLVTFLGLWFYFQSWAVDNALLRVGATYYTLIAATFIVVSVLSYWKKPRIVIACLAPLVLISMGLIRAYDFWTPQWQGKAPGPNVLLIIADTLRRDHTSMYGYSRDTTPFLASMAKEAAVFDDVVSSAAWTKPSMASLLSSRYLEQDRVMVGPLPIEWDGVKLPEFMNRSGYETALFTANPNTGSYFEATRGYEWIMQATPPRHFATQNFVLPKLLQTYFRFKEWLKYRNAQSHLDSFRKALGFRSLSSLSRYSNGYKKSDKISVEDEPYYKKEIGRALRSFALFNIRVHKKYPKWRLDYLIPIGDPLFRSVLKFCFITLEGAGGELVNYWIRDKNISDSFMNWFDHQYEGKKPFFVHMQYMGPHTPYTEQDPYLIPHFDRDSIHDAESPPSQHTLPSVGAKRIPPDKLYNLISNYDDSIRITDANIQSVIKFLEKRGALDNTLVVFASDHGEAFYEHGIYGHMYSLHSEVVNVPLFFWWPGKIKPGRSELPASLIDIYPSLITLSGNDQFRGKAKDLEGFSLFQDDGQLADAKRFNNRIRYAHTRITAKDLNTEKKKQPQRRRQRGRRGKRKGPRMEVYHRMVIQNGQKLVEEIEGKDTRHLFLFDLNDPREERIEANRNDPAVAHLLDLFRPLPKAYEDINEPQIENHPLDPDEDEKLEDSLLTPPAPVAQKP